MVAEPPKSSDDHHDRQKPTSAGVSCVLGYARFSFRPDRVERMMRHAVGQAWRRVQGVQNCDTTGREIEMKKRWIREGAAIMVMMGTTLVPTTVWAAGVSGSTTESTSTGTSAASTADVLSDVWTLDEPDTVAANSSTSTGAGSGALTAGQVFGGVSSGGGSTGSQSSSNGLSITDDSEEGSFSGLVQTNGVGKQSDEGGDQSDVTERNLPTQITTITKALGLDWQDHGDLHRSSDDGHGQGGSDEQGDDSNSTSVSDSVYLTDGTDASDESQHGDGDAHHGHNGNGASVSVSVYSDGEDDRSVSISVYTPSQASNPNGEISVSSIWQQANSSSQGDDNASNQDAHSGNHSSKGSDGSNDSGNSSGDD